MTKAQEIAEEIMVSDPQWTDETVRRKCSDDRDLTREVIRILKLQDSGQLILDQLQSRFGRAPAFDFKVNEKFGEYQLVAFVGRGGFGEVWQARKVDSDSAKSDADLANVVLKISNDRGDLDLEINALEKVNSINGVAKLLDHGQVNGIPYVVMEHVPGATLADLLNDPSWPETIDEAKECVIELARILADIHSIHPNSSSKDEHPQAPWPSPGPSAGIAHGDVTPSNIIVRHGHPVLIDFGTSFQKHNDDHTAEVRSIPSRPLSFTPNYRVPEVVYGIGATTSADVYQIGLIAYEVVSGEKFTTDRERDNEEEGFDNIAIRAGDHFAAIVRKCLSWDPNDRFRNAVELHSALGGKPSATAFVFNRFTSLVFATLVVATLFAVYWFNRPTEDSTLPNAKPMAENGEKEKSTESIPDIIWSDNLREDFDDIILPFWWDATNFDLSEIYSGAGFAEQKQAEFEQLIGYCNQWIERHPKGFPRIQNEVRWTRNWLSEMLEVAPLAVAFDRKKYLVQEASVSILVNGKSIFDEKLVNLPVDPVIPLNCRIFDVIEVKLLLDDEVVASDHFVYLMAYNVGMKPNGLRFELLGKGKPLRVSGALIATSRMAPPVLPTRPPPHRANRAVGKRQPNKN